MPSLGSVTPAFQENFGIPPIEEEVPDDSGQGKIRDQLLQQIATLFEASQNRQTEASARQNVGAATQSARIRGETVKQAEVGSSQLAGLEQFFAQFNEQRRQFGINDAFRNKQLQQQFDLFQQQLEADRPGFFDALTPFLKPFGAQLGKKAADALFD